MRVKFGDVDSSCIVDDGVDVDEGKVRWRCRWKCGDIDRSCIDDCRDVDDGEDILRWRYAISIIDNNGDVDKINSKDIRDRVLRLKEIKENWK